MSITQWHVPVDDTHCYWYAIFTSFTAPVDKATMRAQRLQTHSLPDYAAARADRHNDWGYDPDEQRSATYTGMGMDINVHDQWAVESMGAIQDRTQEHLGYSDRIITAARRMFFRAIDDVAEGRDPPLTRGADAVRRARDDRRGRAGRAACERYWQAPGGGTAARNALAARGQWKPRERFRCAPRTVDAATAGRRRRRSSQRIDETRHRCASHFPIAHGVVRGKTLIAAEAMRALRTGVTCTATMVLKDLSGRTAFPIFQPRRRTAPATWSWSPTPTTFRVLPWAPHSGWILCDLYRNGRHAASVLHARADAPHAGPARRARLRLARRPGGRIPSVASSPRASPRPDHIAMPGPPPKVMPLNHGYQYLTELRYDALEPLLETLRGNLQALGLPLRSMEVEFGPSQVEVTFGATTGMEPADLMLLFRSATKQIFARAGYLASFMCRPQLPHAASSGWHLHHSIEDAATGRNLFPHADGLSPTGAQLAGRIVAACAAAAAAFSTPTINGYKRYHAELDGAGSCRVGL